MNSSGQRISEYVLVEKIGEGGFGEVWKAKHHVFDEIVAVKIPTDPAFVGQLRTEGLIQRNLKHPNIVQTLGFDPAADPPYCVMEYVPGMNLREHLRHRGQLPFREASEIAIQIVDALAYAHAQGVVHRDIKPENILITPGPHVAVKVSDFGLGRVAETVSASLYLSGRVTTTDGKTLSGTLDYMSPEQKRGVPVDARSDIYTFGLVFYEMLMGELPVGAFRYPSDLYPDVPARLTDFLRRCLAPVPSERFLNGTEALEALRRVAQRETEFIDAGSGVAFRRGEPFVFGAGIEVYTLRELVEAILKDPETGRQHLYAGQLEPWLRGIREKELSRRAVKIREEEPDGRVGLQQFLEATGLLASPRMDLDVSEIDLGEIARGETRSFRIHLTSFGRGILWGEAVAEGAPAWISPSRQPFRGERMYVEFTIQTAALAAGQSLSTVLNVESNGGQARVPLRFRVGPRPAHLEVAGTEVNLAAPRGSRATGVVRVRNAGDATLSLSASWSEDWIEVDRLQDLGPGEERDVRIRVRPPRKLQGTIVTRLTFVSNGGSRDVFVRVTPVSSFTLASFLLAALVGLVPFVAELLGAILALDAFFGLFRKEPRPERRSKLSFLAGLLPGIAWHLWMLFR